ncbi:MAG: GNAT family N-acetyltransferase [Anaerolineales bacterium]|nr:GNAT family N-acetyltransferase [Anaerolineales bacterium]
MSARMALELKAPRNGPRQLNPVRDLGSVADLLEIVFASELDAGGRQMIREARAFSHTGPLIHLFSPWSVGAGGLLPGFVWEKDGKIIGNVTVFRSSKNQDMWKIANVAVHPEYRRMKIATRLMNAVIDHIMRHKGRSIALQVNESNRAVALYQKLGFTALGSVTRWQSGNQLHPDLVKTGGRPLRKAVKDDWLPIWRLFSSVTPAAQGWPDPLQIDDFKPNIWRGIINFFNGDIIRRWVVPAPIQGMLDGYIEIISQPRSCYRLTLRTRIPNDDELTGELLAKGIREMPNISNSQVLIDHPSGEGGVDKQLLAVGFHPKRTLLLMKLNLNG